MARALLTDAEFPVREKELNLDIATDDDAVYWMRSISTDTARQLYKQHTQHKPNPRTHQREEVTDRPALQDALLDYCLVRWEGIAGNPECTLALKKQLPIAIQAALIERAQSGQVTPDQQAASFRQSRDVVPVLAR